MYFFKLLLKYSCFGHPKWCDCKEPSCQSRTHRDTGLIPGLGRSPGGGHGNPLQYYFLENPLDRGAWWTTVHSWRVGYN